MRTIMGALENQAEETWTSHQGMSLNEMHSVASDALDNQRRVCSREQRQDFKGINGKVTSM